MANVPNYTVANISLGPGICYLGVAGTTPTVDIGAISTAGLELNLTQTYLEVFQGSPKSLITQFKTEENLEVKITGIEWNLMELPIALGAGVTTSSASQDTFAFGGSPTTTALAAKIVHSMPSGHTISIYVWQANISGSWQLKMAQDTLHDFPYTFKALVATVAWDGVTALGAGSQLFKIVRQKA